MWNVLSSPPLPHSSVASGRTEPEVRRLIVNKQAEGPQGQSRSARSPEKGRGRTVVDAGVEAATRLPVTTVVASDLEALDDAPERSGSENRHDDVRELESQ
jgi:hypothetical protein